MQNTVDTLTIELNEARNDLSALNALIRDASAEYMLFELEISDNTDKKSLLAIAKACKAEAIGKTTAEHEHGGAGRLVPVSGTFSVPVIQKAILDAKRCELGIQNAREQLNALKNRIADLQEAIANSERYDLINRLLADAAQGSIFEQCEATRQVMLNVNRADLADTFTDAIMRNSYRNNVAVMNVMYEFLLKVDTAETSQPEPQPAPEPAAQPVAKASKK